ncbi:hypothetical protein MPL1032_180221 [Mesorhizobium plurifarium]|uniref:Uncharacterized protein n=1 Tax=Mesorhizobium plurifarium TaxID=69974 RepID=A0A0K2VUN8_MESPL|nr:hypothetical protein MPL1032_180221 [Mesorhizobium plurifarium]
MSIRRVFRGFGLKVGLTLYRRDTSDKARKQRIC